MEHMLWTGRPDPPVVWESEAHYRRRRSVPFAIGLILLGPILSLASFWILLSEVAVVGPLAPLLRNIARIAAPAGVPVTFAGIAWLLLIAAFDYWDDQESHQST